MMEKFKSFITEKIIRDKITILILTNSKSKKPEIVTGMLLQACKDLELPCYTIVTTEAWISDNDIEKGTVAIKNYDGGEKDISVETSSTVVFVRLGALDTEIGLALLGTLQNAGCMMINDRDGMLTCDNKMSSYTAFERSNITTPRTSLVNNEKSIVDAHERIGGKFPVIIKTLTGTQGIGVSKVESMESMMSVIQSLWKFNAPLIIQEFLKIDFDIRTIVLNGRIVASTKRIKPEKDFRSNRHRGATTEPYTLNDKEKEEIIAAARATGAYMCGVDHAIVGGKIYILEVNGSPGLGSKFQNYDITQVPQVPIKEEGIIKYVVEYLQNPLHRRFNFNQESGYHETLEIEGYGPIRAKFDTGNGTRASMLIVDKIDVDGKTVKWERDGKKFTSKLIGISKPVHIGKIAERPMVHIILKFNNMVYTDVPVGLQVEDAASTFLINRDLLTRFKVSVNPNRKFVLSDWSEKGDSTDEID
jgi:RimK family alpha-L-glutamate ligase